MAADGRDLLPNDGPGLPCSDRSAGPPRQQVIEGVVRHPRLAYFGPGIVGEIGVIKKRPEQRGLDLLDVDYEVRDRAANDTMRNNNWGHPRERDLIDLLDIV